MKKEIFVILILIFFALNVFLARSSLAQSSNEYLMRAKRYMVQKEYASAIDEYSQALAEDPNNITIYIYDGGYKL